MSFRLNPFKVLRFIAIVVFLSYAGVEIKKYFQEKNKKTGEITKTFEVRKDDFYNSDDKNINKSNDEKIVENTSQNTVNQDNEKLQTEQELIENSSNVQTTDNSQGTKDNPAKVDTGTENTKNLEKKKSEELEVQKREAALLAKKNKELADKKAKAEAQKKTVENKKVSSGRKYIQVATFQTEETAKKAVTNLGGNFSVQRVKGTSGRTMYRVVSISTDNPATLSSLENQIKNKLGGGTKYIIRTVGKE